MLLALLVIIVCLCLPIGRFEADDVLATSYLWYNFGVYAASGFVAKPILFVDLCVAGTLTFIAIFLYKKRSLQSTLCKINILLCVIWYAYYAFTVFLSSEYSNSAHVSFAACLPLIAIILLLLAIKGIRADENLIKSMDRIR